MKLALLQILNKIPFDEKPPTITSGLRLGTPSVTTRGMGEKGMDELFELITDCLKNKSSQPSLREAVLGLARKFTL